MRPAERIVRIAGDLAGVVPRAHSAVASDTGWNPLSLLGIRQLSEVVLDELALTGMTLTAPPPKPQRSVDSCAAAAAELSMLGVRGAHADPAPLRVQACRRRRLGRQVYEQLRFDHDPALPASLAAFGGQAQAVVHLCRSGEAGRPWLVWVHGAGQGQPVDLLVSRARHLHDELGFNVALPVQPGCGVRRDVWPEYPNMDPLANIAGMMRAVSEVRALVRWLRLRAESVVVAGVSMGSPVAGLVSHLETVDGVAVYTPISGLNAMIAAHLGRWGPSVADTAAVLRSTAAEQAAAAVDYHAVAPTAPPERRLIVGAWHDQMARREPALALHDRWGGRLHWHRGSHVGHLFAGGVQKASEEFLRSVVARTRPGSG